MKKILLIIFLCLFSVLINAKTINTKGDNLLKQCNIKIKKNKSADGIKSYNYCINAKIGGQLVDIDDKPIINQKIYVKLSDTSTLFNTPIATIYSNENGMFQYEINEKYKTCSKNIDLEILLQFNEKSIEELKTNFQEGNDFSINNPYEISIQLDKEQENSLYIPISEIKTRTNTRNNKDIIILNNQSFSAQYYRDEIKKNIAINKAKEMLQEADINIGVSQGAIQDLILDEKNNLKNDWDNIINGLISINKMFKNANCNFDISTIEILVLDENKNLRRNWKEIVNQEIIKEKKEKDRLNRIAKRKKRIIEDPDSCNLTYKNEKEIFDAIGFNEYDLSVNLKRAFEPLFYVESGTWIAVPVQIFQILGNNQFLFKYGENNYGPTLFHGNLKKCCRKDVFYAGQWVDVVGVINGTSSYVTVFGETKTIPKVKVYAIRPSVAMQNRYY